MGGGREGGGGRRVREVQGEERGRWGEEGVGSGSKQTAKPLYS